MHTPIRPRFVPPPFQDSADSGRLILRDGTTAQLQRARAADSAGLQEFFHRLSPDARRHRFFSATLPGPDLAAFLCDDSDPRRVLTLLVSRTHEHQARIIAAGSYVAHDPYTAEVAFAVDDASQGKGIGTLLLERLAFLAVRHGFCRLRAVSKAGCG